MDSVQIIIIGSGPSGYTAAIYASRAGFSTVLFEGQNIGGQPGGQLMLTTQIENFPGFPEGISGHDLMAKMKEQAIRFGTKIISEDVTGVDFSSRPFGVSTLNTIYKTNALIICTGAHAAWLGIEGEEKYQGRGVSACATCDGFFFRGKIVVVVGGGDAALEEAIFLTRFAEKVFVVHRRDELKASKIMQERAFGNSKIEFTWNSEVREVLGDENKMTGVLVQNNKTNEKTEIKSDGLFVAIGHRPNTDLFQGKIDLDERGYIVTKSGSTSTSVEGVFAGGDVADRVYRQAITSAGTGCMAALDAERWLSSK